MSQWFKPISAIAFEAFKVYLKEFFEACPEWTRASLLRSAKMDPGFIRRVERGQGYNVKSLDRLLRFMGRAVSGKVQMAAAPKQVHRKGNGHERYGSKRGPGRSASSSGAVQGQARRRQGKGEETRQGR
jgi:hypothetical protein